MNRLLAPAMIATAITLTAAACATEDGPAAGESSASQRSLRSTQAATRAISLSAQFSDVAAARARSNATGDAGKSYVDVIDEECVRVEIGDTSVLVELSGCGVEGRINIAFAGNCLDPDALDECLDAGLDVELELDIDGLSVAGDIDIAEDGATSGSLSVSGSDVENLDIDFDLAADLDGTCSTFNGTINVDNGVEVIAVDATNLVDCGGTCPDSGVLEASTGDESVLIDFDAGTAEITDGTDTVTTDALDCN